MPASTWPQWYSCVLDTYKALARTHTAISVVGFSTGCQLALHLATQYPVRRLALLSPYVRLRYRWYYGLPPESYILSLGRWIDDVPRLWLPIRDRQMEAAARQVVFFNTFNLAAVRSAMELIESVKPTLSKIATPTSILQADNDSVVDPSGAAELYQCLGSPIKELHWLPQSDHIIPLDLERETVFARVGAFLQK
jgi:carboxylesterase